MMKIHSFQETIEAKSLELNLKPVFLKKITQKFY